MVKVFFKNKSFPPLVLPSNKFYVNHLGCLCCQEFSFKFQLFSSAFFKCCSLKQFYSATVSSKLLFIFSGKKFCINDTWDRFLKKNFIYCHSIWNKSVCFCIQVVFLIKWNKGVRIMESNKLGFKGYFYFCS